MRDRFGRKIEYMRISVTDRCNLRCVYCMPEEGVEQTMHSEILTFDEILRICRIGAGLGISKIKLTGGEPLVRRGVENLVRELKEIKGIEEVTLTTNGILLAEKLPALCAAGLDAVNISLDTMDAGQYEQITRREGFKQVMEGIRAALSYSGSGLRVKINCVALAEVNKEQWVKIAELAKQYPMDVRFIEMMPIGLGKEYPGSRQEEILSFLEEAYGRAKFEQSKLTESGRRRGNGPAVYVSFPDFKGKIGFISAMSHKFCGDCNRIRMTSEGFIKPCLQYAQGIHMRELLRNGTEDAELERLLQQVIYEKPRCHQFEEKDGDGNLEEKQMSRIGG